MAWIESHQKLERHPKTLHLASLTGDHLDIVLGRLHRFWWWCLEYAEDGDLRKYDLKQMSSLLGFDAEHLVTSKWIDEQPYVRVHDWWDYIGNFLMRKYKNYPKKWKKIRALYVGKPKSSPKNTPKNTANPILPNHHLTIPNLTKEKERRVAERPATPVGLLIQGFYQRLEKKLGEPPVYNRGAAARGFTSLLKTYEKQEIENRMEKWFQSTDEYYVRENFRVELFLKYFNSMRINGKKEVYL